LARYERLLEEEDIECSLNITTAYDVCLTERCATIGKRAFHSRRADFPEDMKNFREIEDVEEIERLSGAKGAYWGCMYRVGSIHPYRLANGIMRRCFALSKVGGGWVNLQTQTPVESIQHQGGRWSATTANGPVSAPKLVVCCNGYVSHLLPELANKVIPARGSVSSILLPDPQPSSTPSLKLFRPLTASYSLKYQPDAFDYMICRQEDVKNIIVGGAEKVMVGKPHLWYGNTDDTQNMWVPSLFWRHSSDRHCRPGTEEYWSDFMPKQFINYPGESSRVDRVWTGGEPRKSGSS
jgi:glycine/D-amino acid oxidase-like deaminating enzyme